MARVVREEEHAVKRKEILEAAIRFVFTKGYEQMSIQNIVETLQISKGAFYHYFGSKQAVLEGLIESMLAEVEAMLAPIVSDPHLPAVDKLRSYFGTAVRWKTAQKELLLGLLRVWYTDQNAIVRQKQQALAFKRVAPMLGAIIRQGVNEGSFTTEYPEQTAQVVLALVTSMGDTWADLLLSTEPRPEAQQQLASMLLAYSDALERVLGAPRGSLPLMDEGTLIQWLPASRQTA